MDKSELLFRLPYKSPLPLIPCLAGKFHWTSRIGLNVILIKKDETLLKNQISNHAT